MHILGYKKNEMVAVQLARSYCMPSLWYGCEVWHTREHRHFVFVILLDLG